VKQVLDELKAEIIANRDAIIGSDQSGQAAPPPEAPAA
jgi:hypothetical protein